MILRILDHLSHASTVSIEATIETPLPGVDGKTSPGTLHLRPCYNNIYTTLPQCSRYDPCLRRLERC
jgi:hypothetical protein